MLTHDQSLSLALPYFKVDHMSLHVGQSSSETISDSVKKTNSDFQKQTSSFKNKLRIPKSNSFFLKTKSVIRYKQISL